LIVVTHDPQFLVRLEEVHELHGGRLSRRAATKGNIAKMAQRVASA